MYLYECVCKCADVDLEKEEEIKITIAVEKESQLDGKKSTARTKHPKSCKRWRCVRGKASIETCVVFFCNSSVSFSLSLLCLYHLSFYSLVIASSVGVFTWVSCSVHTYTVYVFSESVQHTQQTVQWHYFETSLQTSDTLPLCHHLCMLFAIAVQSFQTNRAPILARQ